MGEVVRVRLDLAYDGTDFSGWAAQPGRRTVEGELSAALTPCSAVRTGPAHGGRPDRRRRPRAGAGRPRRLAAEHGPVPVVPTVARRGAPHPADRRPPAGRDRHRVGRAPAGFDARFSATSRRYLYRLADDLSVHDPLRRRDTVSVRGHLTRTR